MFKQHNYFLGSVQTTQLFLGSVQTTQLFENVRSAVTPQSLGSVHTTQ